MWGDVLDGLQRRMGRELGVDAFQRDPAYIRDHMPTIGGVVERYFAPEVRGLERLPGDGPFILVGNHSGGLLMPDGWALASALVSRFGAARPIYALMLDFAFAIPGASSVLRRLGAVPASVSNAERALALGAGVLVYPGGAWEVYRPWTERHRIELRDRTGFVRLALRHGLPVYPAVAHGGHDSLIVVSRGDRLARLMGLRRLRIDVFPIILGLPFGVTWVFGPYVPLPAKIVVEVQDPLDWSGYGAGAADDPAVVQACYAEVTDRMQRALDRLAHDMPHPLVSRLLGAAGLARGTSQPPDSCRRALTAPRSTR
jgi:1-acyl-sn-glycerol-3-phosphate acyltransferase